MSNLNKIVSDPFPEFNSFEELFKQAELRPDYWLERAKLEFTREVLTVMKDRGISRSQLAEKLDVRPGMITRLLSGKNNFELATMIRLAMALDCRFRCHLCHVEHNSMWIDILKEEPENVIPWNPETFKIVEMCQVPREELHYVPIAVNS